MTLTLPSGGSKGGSLVGDLQSRRDQNRMLTVTNTPEPSHSLTATKNLSRVIPRVVTQYKRFDKKRKRMPTNRMNIRPFVSPIVRQSCLQSCLLNNTSGPVVSSASLVPLKDYTTSKTITLKFMTTPTQTSLGGIVFVPMHSGMTIPITLPDGRTVVDSLNVRVGEVLARCPARENKITTSMYVKTFAMVDPGTKTIHAPVWMNSSEFRESKSESEKQADKWRGPNIQELDTKLNLIALMDKVDDFMSTALSENKLVQVVFLKYNE